jgi:peptidoglycan/LPS O-acetylase OafA/YrhL
MSPLTNIRNLHITRGLAALLVVVFHAKYILWVGGKVFTTTVGLHNVKDYLIFSIDMLSSCGRQCVMVFFILSAFVIRHTTLNHRYTWIEFYKHRIIRIYVPFLFSLIFSASVLYFAITKINPAIYSNTVREFNTSLYNSFNGFSVKQVINTFLFIDNHTLGKYTGDNFAYWSLGHELIFYLLFPFYGGLKKNNLFLLSALLVIVFLLTGLAVFYYQIFFLAGLLLYEYFQNISQKPLIKNRKIYWLVLIIFFIAVNLTKQIISGTFSDIVTLVYSFFIFDYILFFVKEKNKKLMTLGDISYTLYLNHIPVLILFYSILSLYTEKLVFYSRIPYYSGVILALILAFPIYYLTEKPSINLLKRMKKKDNK